MKYRIFLQIWLWTCLLFLSGLIAHELLIQSESYEDEQAAYYTQFTRGGLVSSLKQHQAGASLDDLRALKASGAPLDGVISGRALYDGAIDLKAALDVLS